MPKRPSKKTPKKKKAPPKKVEAARAPAPAVKKMGRPPADPPRTTISYRVPVAVEAAFEAMAAADSKRKAGGSVTKSSLYNEAMAAFLHARGVSIPGYT